MADLTREQIEAWRSLYYKAEDALTPKGIEQLPILCDMALRALERTPTEAREKKLEEALKHILWVKDCGVDGTDENGVFRNWPETERDKMYDIAKAALSTLGACPRCGKSAQWRKDNGCSDSGCPASRPQSNGKE